MQAIILAGGAGTRLRPLTEQLPKPMLPVMNRPLMEHIIHLLKKHNITDIGVTLGYKPDVIKQYFKNGAEFGVKLTYFTEPEPLGTAGSVKTAERFLDDTFLVVSGDALTDCNLTAALYYHNQKNAAATLVLKESEEPCEYGIVATNASGAVTHFLEKPDWDEVYSDTVNTGIYILDKEVLSHIPNHTFYDFSKNLFPKLLELKLNVFGYITKEYWCDVGDIRAYQSCHRDVFEQKVQLALDPQELAGGVYIGKDCEISKSATIEKYTVIGDNCKIGADCTVRDSILWHDITLEAGRDIYKSVLFGRNEVNQRFGSNAPHEHTALVDHHYISGTMNREITPEYAASMALAFASSLPVGADILLNIPDYPECMMVKFALLSGLMSAGAQVYNLCGANDRGVAKYAMRQLHMDGAITASLKGSHITFAFWGAGGTAASKDICRNMKKTMANGEFHRTPLDKVKPPINVSDIAEYYLKDVVATTNYKRLNFSVGVCTDSHALRVILQKISSSLGIVFLFTNDPEMMPELVTESQLDFGVIVSERGQFGLMDDTGSIVNADQFYSLVSLMVMSAVSHASVYVPQHISEMVNTVARSCGGSIVRLKEQDIEDRLLTLDNAASRLQAALCFDSVKCIVRICEFLYLNNCTLSHVLNLFPQLHKINRDLDCPPEKLGRVMRRLLNEYDESKTAVDLTEGVKVYNDNGWVLVMPDGNNRNLHVMAESGHPDYAFEMAEEFCAKLNELIKK